MIAFATRKVVATWQVGGSPDMLQVSADGSQLWVWIGTNHGRGGVHIDGHVIRQIEVGGDPHGLAFFPQPGRFSLGHNGVYR